MRSAQRLECDSAFRNLTPDRVHLIRVSGLTDAYWARTFGVRRQTVRLARIGETFADHPTPPDLRPRLSPGRFTGSHAVYADDPAGNADINQALRSWRLPTSATGNP